ncbi:unnamed protein product [Caenorhabditis nigoni]
MRNFQFQMLPAPAVYPVRAYAPLPFFITNVCFYKRINVIGVHRGNSCYAFYEYSSGKFHWHECKCQLQTTESNLTPHYAVYSERRKDYVIFVDNLVTDKIEQYIFNTTTGGLEQVDYSELVYDRNLRAQGLTVATLQNGRIVLEVGRCGGIRKLSHSYGQWVEIPRIAVKTLRGVPKDSRTTTTYPTTNTIPSTFFKIDNCTNARVHATGDGYFFQTYQYYNGDFFSCQPCLSCPDPNILMDSQLIPRYCTFSKQHNAHVIFARNSATSWVGKYIYTNQGFLQVNYSDVVYDPSVILQSNTLCVLEKGTVVVYQNRNGSLSVDRWDEMEKQFRTVPPKRVRAEMKRGQILEGSKDAEDSKDSGNSGNSEDSGNPKDSDCSKGSKNPKNSEDSSDSEDSDDSDDSEDSEDSEDSDSSEDSEDSDDDSDVSILDPMEMEIRKLDTRMAELLADIENLEL